MKILKFPEFRQSDNYDCGAKAMEAVLVYYGFDVNERAVMDIAGTDDSGTSIEGLEKAARHFGLKYEAGQMTVDGIKDYIDKDVPVIILLQAWAERKHNDWQSDWNDGHYVVAIGYDDEKIYFEDPSVSFRAYLAYEELAKRWHDGEGRKKYVNYGMAIFGKKSHYDPEKMIHMG